MPWAHRRPTAESAETPKSGAGLVRCHCRRARLLHWTCSRNQSPRPQLTRAHAKNSKTIDFYRHASKGSSTQRISSPLRPRARPTGGGGGGEKEVLPERGLRIPRLSIVSARTSSRGAHQSGNAFRERDGAGEMARWARHPCSCILRVPTVIPSSHSLCGRLHPSHRQSAIACLFPTLRKSHPVFFSA